MTITDQSLTQLETSIRQTPLAERLESAQRMISRMCSKGEPPRMSVPAQASDEDMYIITTLQDAAAEIERLRVESNYLRTWIMMETGVDEQHISDVLSIEAELSDVVKNRYG